MPPIDKDSDNALRQKPVTLEKTKEAPIVKTKEAPMKTDKATIDMGLYISCNYPLGRVPPRRIELCSFRVKRGAKWRQQEVVEKQSEESPSDWYERTYRYWSESAKQGWGLWNTERKSEEAEN